MKTVYYEEYGSPAVLQIRDIPKPQAQKNEILIKVHTSTVTSGTIWARTGKHPDSRFFSILLRLFFGIKKPRKKILGYEFSGEVVSTGSEVSKYKPGDEVFGTTTGLKSGSYCEYICVPEQWNQGVMALKPESMNHSEASALPVGAMTALHLLRKGKIKKGQKVLIYGASGSVGSYAVQLAKHMGAIVWGICSTANLNLVQSIGADHVVDYTKEDIAHMGREFDLVFDAVGKISRRNCREILKKKGTFLSVKSPTSESKEKLDYICKLFDQGILIPLIDKEYPLEQIAEAHEYAGTGHKKGNVVIRVI